MSTVWNAVDRVETFLVTVACEAFFSFSLLDIPRFSDTDVEPAPCAETLRIG